MIYSVIMYDILVYFPKWAVMLDLGLKHSNLSFNITFPFIVYS